jgi:rRNA maturation RNase YbeY
MIDFNIVDVDFPYSCDEKFVSWISFVVLNEQKELGPISYVFTSDSYLLEINKQYLNHDYYTDIITFDYTDGLFVSGDLFISYDRIKDHSSQYNVDLFEEFLRVCVHGVLHLLGYKDKLPEDEQLMRKKESFYIQEYVSRETYSI